MTIFQHKCRICKTEDNHPTFIGREMMFGTREEFEYFQCKSCSCLQITNIPDNLSRFYPKDYYSLNSQPIEPPPHILNFFLKQRFRNALFNRGYKLNKILSNFIKIPTLKVDKVIPATEFIQKANIANFDARFLDVGCGQSSNWLNTLRQMGFKNLFGVDPFIESDARYNGITIFKRPINEMIGNFDFISFHHSLEHIPEQETTLAIARSLLSENGVILIRIPIVSSYVWDHYGTNWVEMDVPRHIYLHSLESIRLLGERVGLTLYETIYDSLILEFYGSEQYLRNIPLTADNSYWLHHDNQIFTDKEIDEFINLAEYVNKNKTGGRACFLFKKSSH